MDGLINFTGTLSGEIEDGGGSGVTPHVTADASVNDQTGVPGVTVVRSGPDAAPHFDFEFVNLKGADGAPGAQGPQGLTGATGPAGAQGPRGFTGATGATGPAGADGYSPAVTITDITGGHRVTITDETHPLGQNFDIMNGIDGTDGQDGSPGPEGPQGPTGAGVPTGGTTGQYLRKAGPGDYITEWADPTPDALPVISDEYDDYTAYSVGDYCIHENTLYKCNTDITPYEVWDPTHWDACTVGEEIAAANSDIAALNASLTQLHANAYTITKIDGTLTTTETTYNNMQVGGEYRKFSDYDYLLFLLKFSNSDIRDTVLIPASYWASGSQIARQILHGAGGTTAANYNVSGIISKYNNDTSIKANTTGNNTFTYLEIIGLKIQAN